MSQNEKLKCLAFKKKKKNNIESNRIINFGKIHYNIELAFNRDK